MNKNKRSTRNWFLTLFALMIAGFIGWAAVVCWTNLHHDTFMIGAAAVLTCTSLLFLLAAVTGKAEDFFLALIAWW
jgi:predicted neutral ceramidase superfamily lipid hydrolase